ncbi:MAG TPA: hypothetical protein VKW76_00700 [Candidatus Binatia bacterium]|nr:hypothetical protein [Candidatus Binatia bacterium]
MPLRLRALIALALAARAAIAGAACTQAIHCVGGTTNDAATIVARCCGATSCVLDGTITLSGSVCNLDFGAHAVALSGQIAAGSSTLALTATSVQLGGGTLTAPGGTVTITTTGHAATAFAMSGAATIDVSGSDAGALTILADGAVSLSAGSILADGTDDGASGGNVTIDATADAKAGPMLLAGRISADSGASGFGGTVTVRAPGALTVRNLVSAQGGFDVGTIDLEAGGPVAIASGAMLDGNAIGGSGGDGGTITIDGQAITVADTVQASADGAGSGGDVELTASAGAIGTSGGGIAANGDTGNIVLTTESPVPSGDVTLASPLSAQATDPDPTDATGSGTIAVQAAGSITVGKSLWVTGNGSGDSEIDLDARGDVAVNATVTGNDPAGGGALFVQCGRNATLAATVQMRSNSGDVGSGGTIEVAAGGNVGVTGTGTQLDVTGASGDGGTIALSAEGDVTVNAGTQLLADSTATGGVGGVVRASGGTRCDARLCDPVLDPTPARDVAGGLTLGGKVSATPGPSSATELAGCSVTVGGSALVTSGGGNNTVIARSALTLQSGARLLTVAPGTNRLTRPSGVTPILAGATITPPATTDPRASCTGSNDQPGCLDPCPQCGNGGTPEFPEQCDGGPANVPCTSGCDTHCRIEPAQDDGNPCTLDGCDAFGPYHANVPDFTACPADPTTTCPRACVAPAPTVPSQCTVVGQAACDDGNPCTYDCLDPGENACVHPPHDGPGIAGCDDGNPCTGVETCSAGACRPGTPVVCPQQTPFCDRTASDPGKLCIAKPCTTGAQCDDGNPCTTDTCVNNSCANTPVTDGTSCSDGDACNGAETCAAGVCVHAPPPDCDDGNPCTDDTCDPATGCVHAPIPGCCNADAECADGDAVCPKVCAEHACTLATPGCCHTDADCDDGEPCNGTETCGTDHVCHAGTPLANGAACGTTCDPGTCTGGACETQPLVCTPSADPCVDVGCRDGAGCVAEPIDGCCHQPGTDAACDDGDACTRDVCADVGLTHLACEHLVEDRTCRPCATDTDCAPHGRCDGQACRAGVCTAVGLACDDHNVDTDDVCTLDTSLAPHCQHFCLDDRGCDDGDVCNGRETCDVATGACSPGTPLACDDGDACDGVETCDPASGCHAGQALTGFAGVHCQLDAISRALAAASPADLAAGLRRKLGKGLAKLAGAVAAAERGGKPRRVTRLLSTAGKLTRTLAHQIDAARRKRKPQIAAALADALARRLGGAGATLSGLETHGR